MDGLCEALSPGVVRDVCHRVVLGVSSFHPSRSCRAGPWGIHAHVPRVFLPPDLRIGDDHASAQVDPDVFTDGDRIGAADGKVLYSQEGNRTGSSTFQETCGLLADRHSGGCARVVLLVAGGRRIQNSNVANECFTLPVTTAATAAFGSLQMA